MSQTGNSEFSFRDELTGPRIGDDPPQANHLKLRESSVQGIEEERPNFSNLYGVTPEASSRPDLNSLPFYSGVGEAGASSQTVENPMEGMSFWGPKFDTAKQYATTFLVSGVIDSAGAAAGGVAGITALAMGKDMEEAADIIGSVAGYASENITMGILNKLGEPGEYEKVYNNIGEAMGAVMLGAGDLAEKTVFKVPLALLEASGVDTLEIRAGLHAWTQASLVAGMLAFGARGSKNTVKAQKAQENRGVIDLDPEDWHVILRDSVNYGAEGMKMPVTTTPDYWAQNLPPIPNYWSMDLFPYGKAPPLSLPPPVPRGPLRLIHKGPETGGGRYAKPAPKLLEDRRSELNLTPVELPNASQWSSKLPEAPTFVHPLSRDAFNAILEGNKPLSNTRQSLQHAEAFDAMTDAGTSGDYVHYVNLIDDVNNGIGQRMRAYEQAMMEEMGANPQTEPVTGFSVPGQKTPFGPQSQALRGTNAAHRRAMVAAVQSTVQKYADSIMSARELVSGSEVDPAAAGIFALRRSIDLSNEAIFKMMVSKMLFRGMKEIGPEQAKGRNMQELQSLMDRIKLPRNGGERMHELQNMITEELGWEAQYRAGPDGHLVFVKKTSPLYGVYETLDMAPGKRKDLSYTSLLEPITDVAPLPGADQGNLRPDTQSGVQKERVPHEPTAEERQFAEVHQGQYTQELVRNPKTGKLEKRPLEGYDTLSKPDMEGPRQRISPRAVEGPYDTFNYREKLVLHRTLNTLREALFVPEQGMLVQLQGQKPIRELALEMWGEAAKNAKEGALTEGGEFLTPAHVKLLRQLAHKAIAQDTPLTLSHMVPGWEKYVERAFMSYAEPIISSHRAYNRLVTLEDAGMRGTGAKRVRSGPPTADLTRANARLAEKNRIKGIFEEVQGLQKKSSDYRDLVNSVRAAKGKPIKQTHEFSKRGQMGQIRATKPKVPYDRPTDTKRPGRGFENQAAEMRQQNENNPFTDPDRVISSKTPWDRQRGATDGFGFIRAMDSLIRRYQQRKRAGKPYNRPDSTVRAQGGYNVWQHVKMVAGGQAMGPLFDRIAAHTAVGAGREMGQLAAMIDILPPHLATQHTASIVSYHQIRQHWYGELVTSMKNKRSVYSIWDQHSAKLLTGLRRTYGALPGGKHLPGALTMARVRPELNKIAFDDVTSGLPPRTEIGEAIRDWFDDVYNLSSGVGIEPHTRLNGYYPPYFSKQMQNPNSSQRARFVRMAEKKGIPTQVINNALEMIVDGDGLMTTKPTADRNPSPEHKSHRLETERKFLKAFSVRELKPFLADNVYSVMIKYAQETLDRIAVAERYGPNDEIWIEQMDRAIAEAKELGMPVGEKEIDHWYDVRNMTTHTYKTGYKMLNKFQRVGIAIMNWSLLGMVVPGSIMEPAIGLMNPTFRGAYAETWAKSQLPRFVRGVARAVWRGVPPDIYMQLASDVGRGVDAAIHEHLTAMSAADKGSTWSNLAFVVNGQHSLTNAMIYAGTEAFVRTLKEVTGREAQFRAKRLNSVSDIHQADVAALEYYGLNMEELLRWQRDGNPFDGTFYRNKVQAGLIKYLFDVVLTPRGSNISPWMNNSSLAAFAHLMSYVSMMGNKISPELFHQLRGNLYASAPKSFAVKNRARLSAMGALMGFLVMSVLSEEMMDLHKYGGSDKHPLSEKAKTESDWMRIRIARFINRSGLGGLPLAKAFDIYEMIQYRQIKGSDLTGAVIGPLWSTLLDLSAGAMMAFHNDGMNAKEFAKMVVQDLPIPMMSAMPKKKESPSAKLVGSKEEFQKEIENWLVDQGFPRGGKRATSFFGNRGGRGYFGGKGKKKGSYYH